MLHSGIIYGPINSRRFGLSLGINLISPNSKVCSYNCIYCECGLNNDSYKISFVSEEDLINTLKENLNLLKNKNIQIDAITYSGNGEPTLHPDFFSITKKVKKIKDKFFPNTKTVLLTNGTQVFKKEIKESITYIDIPVFKIDSANIQTAKKINQFSNYFDYNAYLSELMKLKNKIYIQTILIKGIINNEHINNTTKEEIDALISVYLKISPIKIYLYTLDRKPPFQTLIKIPSEELLKISNYISSFGLNVAAY